MIVKGGRREGVAHPAGNMSCVADALRQCGDATDIYRLRCTTEDFCYSSIGYPEQRFLVRKDRERKRERYLVWTLMERWKTQRCGGRSIQICSMERNIPLGWAKDWAT